MLTQCPHCLTLFRIKPEQLKVAAGKVRCCQCNSVFNALQSLQESPVAFTQETAPSAEAAWQPEQEPDAIEQDQEQESEDEKYVEDSEPQTPTYDFLDEQTDDLDNDTTSPTDDLDADTSTEDSDTTEDSSEVSDFVFEQDDGLEPEPDYFAAGTESQMSELLDQDSSSILLEEETTTEPDQTAAEVLDFKPKPTDDEIPEPQPAWESFGDSILKDEIFDKPEERPDYDSIPAFRASDEPAAPSDEVLEDERVYDFLPIDKDKPKTHRLPWFIGVLLLLLLMGGQLAWQWRDKLIQHDMGRQLLSTLCQVTGCTLPVRRDTDKIVIQGRNLGTHPNKPDALYLQLNMVNTAAFEQPFPKLQLTLYNDTGKLIARRTFMPSEYLPAGMAAQTLMPRAQPIMVEMELADPGKEVTGFTFDFL